MDDQAESIATLAKNNGLGDVEVHYSPETDIWSVVLPDGKEIIGFPFPGSTSYTALRDQILARRALRRRFGVPGWAKDVT